MVVGETESKKYMLMMAYNLGSPLPTNQVELKNGEKKKEICRIDIS